MMYKYKVDLNGDRVTRPLTYQSKMHAKTCTPCYAATPHLAVILHECVALKLRRMSYPSRLILTSSPPSPYFRRTSSKMISPADVLGTCLMVFHQNPL